MLGLQTETLRDRDLIQGVASRDAYHWTAQLPASVATLDAVPGCSLGARQKAHSRLSDPTNSGGNGLLAPVNQTAVINICRPRFLVRSCCGCRTC